MKALLIGNASSSIDGVAAAQFDPFFMNRQRLQDELEFTFQHLQAVSIQEIFQVCRSIDSSVDALFIRPDWRDDVQQVQQAIQQIRLAHPTCKLIFIDPWDQVSSLFFGVLPYVDRFVKYQHLKDLKQYHQPLLGGTAITDYFARTQGYNLHNFYVGSAIPPGYEHRISTGWNVVTARRFKRTLFQSFLWKLNHRQLGFLPKDIDIFCHVSYDSSHAADSWYTRHRQDAVDRLQRLHPRYRLAVSGEYPDQRKVSSRQYFRDLQRSRVVVAPFGWGETTWRDYEAVCYDCLLIKPRMDHIQTAPNIYFPNETYVPVRWDLADLEEVCAYYLANPLARQRIVQNARHCLDDYFRHGIFIQQIASLIAEVPASAAGAIAPTAVPPRYQPTYPLSA
jgi:hypothetical protein